MFSYLIGLVKTQPLGVKLSNPLTFLTNCAIVFGGVFHRVCKIYVPLTFFTNLYALFLTRYYYSFHAIKFYAFGILLRVIVRENRAVSKDWGQPISFIFSVFKTKLIRLTLATLTRFPDVSLPRLTTPLVFAKGSPKNHQKTKSISRV